MKRLIIILFLTFSWVNALSQFGHYNSLPKREVRAVWLTTIGGLDWPNTYAHTPQTIEKQKKEFVDILEKLKRANINTVLLQTRIRGTVIYPSCIEPWDGCVSGTPGQAPGYDPLAFAIEECHKRGLEIQAWIVSIPLGRWNGSGCRNMRKKHPELVMKVGDEGFMRPEKEGTPHYLARICEEITKIYDIDGIHLDYIRYPEKLQLKISEAEARENISNIVREIHLKVKGVKPWVKVSCSPIGKRTDLGRYSSRGWNSYNKGCQDVERWLRQGWMDQIYPMMYFRNEHFFPFASDWKEKSNGRTIVSGLGIYFMSGKEGNWTLADVVRQMEVVRNFGIGQAFFRNRFFIKNTKNIYDYAAYNFYTYPALVPEMEWYKHPAPAQPAELRVYKDGNSDIISWKPSTTFGVSYNIYASENLPVDVEDPHNLISIRNRHNEMKVSTYGRHLYYAITTIDRYGKESTSIQSEQENQVFMQSNSALIRNEGDSVFMPPKSSSIDGDYIIFESCAGNIVSTKPYSQIIDIDDIHDGIYIIRSLSAKGRTHRLGWLFIKRKV